MHAPEGYCDGAPPGVGRRSLLRGAVLLGVGAAAGATALTTAAPALAQVGAPTIHNRAAWNARPPSSAVTIRNHRPNKIVIHHTATANQTDTSLARAFSLSRGIQNHHMDTNGWIDAGQQFTISRGGHIMEARHQSLPTLQGGSSFPHGAHAGVQNSESIGIENEGTYTSVAPPAALYDALVHFCAYTCQQYQIPPSQIFGHRDFSATACPGNVFYGMLSQLRNDVADAIDGGGNGGGGDFEAIVDSTSGNFTASGNWGTSSWSSQAYATPYHFAEPVLSSDAAWFRANIPSAGTYQVDAWWPADSGYNNNTPFVVAASGGSQTVHVNQRTNGGRWVNLGSFSLSSGTYNVVGVSRWTTGSGYVLADAVRIRN